MRRPPPLPEPPTPLPPIPHCPWSNRAWRIQNSRHWSARSYPEPRYRFDAPGGEFVVVYAAADRLAAFAEVYRERGHRLGLEDADRHLVVIDPRRPLPLVDLRDTAVLVALGLDERISVGDDYPTCQRWALALYHAYPGACGIAYRARLAGAAETNLAVFADRAAPLVTVSSSGRLRDLEPLVLAAADRYDLTVSFPFTRHHPSA